jgi:hypothetical protein
LPGLVRDAVFGAQQSRKEFPAGGIKEAIEYRDTVKSFGGVQGIKEAKSYLDNYDNLDSLYTEGKPEFVQQIAQGDPEAFERMVPLAIEQFSKQSPEQYQHIMSKVLVNTLDAAGFPNLIEQIYAKADDQTKPLLEKLWNSIEGYRTLAAKVPEKKVDPERQRLEEEKQQWQQQKIQEIGDSVNRGTAQYRNTVIARELKPFAKWEDLDDDRRAAVIREVRERTKKIVNVDEDFKNSRLRYLQAGDSEGLAKLERDWVDQHVPGIVPKVGKLFWSNPKPQPKGDAKPTANGIKPPQGFKTVSAMPTADKIDRRATTRDMVMKNQAVLIGGQKVTWA